MEGRGFTFEGIKDGWTGLDWTGLEALSSPISYLVPFSKARALQENLE